MGRDYNIEGMEAGLRDFNACSEAIRANGKTLVATVESSSDENSASAIKVLGESFNEKLNKFFQLLDDTGGKISEIVANTKRFDESVNS